MEIPSSLFAFVVASVPICIEDWRRLRIPNRLLGVVASVVVAVALLSIPTGTDLVATVLEPAGFPPGRFARSLATAALGAVYAGGVLEATRRITRGALGAGDVKYGFLLGAAAGPALVSPILLAASGAAGLYILARGGGPVPFAPFIAGAAGLGCVVSLLGGAA